MCELLTFGIRGKEDNVVKCRNTILEDTWRVVLRRAEGQVIPSFWIAV
jgi:hypothetical protein